MAVRGTRYPQRFLAGDVVIDPAVALAPMEGVTDLAFRRLIRGVGGPGLTYTEFIPSRAAALCRSLPVRFDPDERPIALQIFGRDPKLMAAAAERLEGQGASIIDINMGCPSKKVCKNSGGSALMREPDHAIAIVKAVVAAVRNVPVTVKMRSGFDATCRNAPELAWRCQEEGAQTVTIHWRTREDRYKGVRNVDKIAEAVQRLSIPVVGNGDILTVADAARMFDETGCAGVMVGRGAIRNPWLPRQIAQFLRGQEVLEPTMAERHQAVLSYFEHLAQAYPEHRGLNGRKKMFVRHTCQALEDGDILKKMALPAKTNEELLGALDQFFGERSVSPPRS
jgi:tRNA-dihydrouridine synthase B